MEEGQDEEEEEEGEGEGKEKDEGTSVDLPDSVGTEEVGLLFWVSSSSLLLIEIPRKWRMRLTG